MTDVSHGRGGAGNMTPHDKTEQYVDGEIVRYGIEGSHGDGAFSSGRGGVANIADRGTVPTPRNDCDLVPGAAVRSGTAADHHVGRGGAGNAVKDEHEGGPEVGTATETPQAATADDDNVGGEGRASPVQVRGLADKLKDKLWGKKW